MLYTDNTITRRLKKLAENYNANSIQVLSDIEHMKLRRGMYIGEGHNPSQLLSEIFDNAIDEVQANASDRAVVTIDHKLNRYTVRDFGRGIPHGMKRLETGEEKEILEILITKANSGGKFDSSSYTTSAGLNGLGLTITNALSKYIKIISNRKGKFVSIYSEGGSNTKLERGKTTEPDGTYVEFIPNPEMFKSSVIPDEFIIDRCKISNALGFKSELYIASQKYGSLINHSFLIYSKQLENKKGYLLRFYQGNFLHLTGVKTNLSAKEFYLKCFNDTLEQKDLTNLSNNTYRRLLKGKLYALKQIDQYFYQTLDVQENFERNSVLCTIATSDGIKTIGFAKVNKINVPKTILNKNKLDLNKPIYTIKPTIKEITK